MLTLAIVMVGGCSDPGESPDDSGGGGTGDDSSSVPECENSSCAYDEFCYEDACQPVQNRSFSIEEFTADYPEDTYKGSCYYKVRATSGGDHCETETERDEHPMTFSTVCKWLVDLDQPDLSFELIGEQDWDSEYQCWPQDTIAEWQFTGVDAVVGQIRSSGDSLSDGGYSIGYSIMPNF